MPAWLSEEGHVRTGVVVWGMMGAVILAIFVYGIYVIMCRLLLEAKESSFSAWIIHPDTQEWVRGIALYGQFTLRWYKWATLSTAPVHVLPRTRLEVVGGPVSSRDEKYIIVRLKSPDELHTFAMEPGNAAGLMSWVNSAPPGIQGR